MSDEENMLKKRFIELSERAFSKNIYTFTEFLSPAEQALLKSCIKGVPYHFDGGYENAEKAVAVFGSEELCGYIEPAPISYIKIEPCSMKFSGDLAHRDFLGSIMSLGIRRSTLGDLIVKENVAYAPCLDNIADYICENLIEIKHTNVQCSKVEHIPEDALPQPVESEFVVASERLDSVISSIYKLSRSESKGLCEHEKVLVGGIPMLSASYTPKEGDIISVRGHGKLIYCGIKLETKKGRLRCTAKIYK
jgi:RNA-binding protein YlmH